HRAGRQALDRRLRPGRRGRAGQAVRRRRPEPPGLPRPRPRPETLPGPGLHGPRTAIEEAGVSPRKGDAPSEPAVEAVPPSAELFDLVSLERRRQRLGRAVCAMHPPLGMPGKRITGRREVHLVVTRFDSYHFLRTYPPGSTIGLAVVGAVQTVAADLLGHRGELGPRVVDTWRAHGRQGDRPDDGYRHQPRENMPTRWSGSGRDRLESPGGANQGRYPCAACKDQHPIGGPEIPQARRPQIGQDPEVGTGRENGEHVDAPPEHSVSVAGVPATLHAPDVTGVQQYESDSCRSTEVGPAGSSTVSSAGARGHRIAYPAVMSGIENDSRERAERDEQQGPVAQQIGPGEEGEHQQDHRDSSIHVDGARVVLRLPDELGYLLRAVRPAQLAERHRELDGAGEPCD